MIGTYIHVQDGVPTKQRIRQRKKTYIQTPR
jgi:hypothetical protein